MIRGGLLTVEYTVRRTSKTASQMKSPCPEPHTGKLILFLKFENRKDTILIAN